MAGEWLTTCNRITTAPSPIIRKPSVSNLISPRHGPIGALPTFGRAIPTGPSLDGTEALRLQPRLASAFCARGGGYYVKAEFDQAIADYTEAIRHQPDYAEAFVGRGMASLGKGELDQAIADCSEAIVRQPNSAEAYYYRGSSPFTVFGVSVVKKVVLVKTSDIGYHGGYGTAVHGR